MSEDGNDGGMSGVHVPWPIMMIGDAGDATRDEIGVKGWYLERLERGGFATPPAFVVEADAYVDSIRLGMIDERLARLWEDARHASPTEVPMLSRQARRLISSVEFSAGFRDAVQEHLELLESRRSPVSADDEFQVAVRSSATPGAVSGPECAGVHSTYLGVTGVDRVLARIHSCWASLFGERALVMRSQGLGSGEPSMAVIVQTLVTAEKSGIIFPTGPNTEILIEATFGLGEPIITGAVEPDRYLVDRDNYELLEMTIGRKQIVLRSGPGFDGHEFVAPEQQQARVIDDAELAHLSRLSTSIDRYFGDSHEVEWSIDRFGIQVLQARPITPVHHLDAAAVGQGVNGIGIGLGWATGRVRIIDRYEDLADLRDGEILVAAETLPEWLPHIRRAGAVITDRGGSGCHAARVAAEEGLPAIVGTHDATTTLAPGAFVTVDASRGWVVPRLSEQE